VGIVAALVMFYEGSPGRPGRGEEMLWLLSAVTMILALLSGCLLTADCISAEKREDTLGFLFLTNLKGYDIVTGKIAIHAVTTACGLLAVFPVFFLPILAGGVTWGETLRVLLGIGVSFLFALSLGVWISTRSRDARNAIMATLTAIVLVVALPLLWLQMLDAFTGIQPWLAGVPQFSPAMLLYYARNDWYAGFGSKVVYWVSVGIFVIASLVLGRLASGSLPRVWQADETKGKTREKRSQQPVVLPGATAGEMVWRRRALPFRFVNPFQELLLRRGNPVRWAKRLRRAATCFFVGMLLFSFSDEGEDDAFVFAIFTLFAMHAAAKFVFAFDATRALNEDQRSSALELLLATPLDERQIAEGQAEAFRIQFKPHVRLLFVLTLALQFTAMVNPELRLNGDDLFFVSSFFWGTMIWTWSDHRVVSWVGMHHALTQNSHIKATMRTFGEMVLLPWSPYFVVLFLMADARFSEEAAGVVTLGWAIGSAVYQGMKARRRQARVIGEFRSLVSGGGGRSGEEGKFAFLWNFFPGGAKGLRRVSEFLKLA
jgi:ABC-type transport system involved in multi-copper enzyme maturation permease subunit